MSQNPQELIDRVSANTGMHLPALAERLGLKERSLRRIRSGENDMSETVRLHLLDLERLYAKQEPNIGKPVAKKGSPSRTTEDPAPYDRNGDEALMLVLARVTAKATVSELAGLISDIAGDENLPPGLRTRVVKILSEFIPQRMK